MHLELNVILTEIFEIRNFNSYGRTAKETSIYKSYVQILSVTAGTLLQRKEVGVYYREHVPQQPGYQGSSILVNS
jgi:hypothetical protein